MCEDCKKIITRFDQTWLRGLEILSALEGSGDSADQAALRTALASNQSDMLAIRREMDDHHGSCHRNWRLVSGGLNVVQEGIRRN